MFDPHTVKLIRSAPHLSNLDLERLPHQLTQVFTAIVALRVRMTESVEELPEPLVRQLDEFRRLANTLEAMVILLPNRSDRDAAAYVAAQAHHLLHMARVLQSPGEAVQTHLGADAISPTVSALLLFLAADQPSDAMELAKELRANLQSNAPVEQSLVEAVAHLAEGRLQELVNFPVPQLLEAGDYEEQASHALYGRLLEGVKLLANSLIQGGRDLPGEATPTDIFREVQHLAAEEIEIAPSRTNSEEFGFSAFATYPGPHQLAALLIPAAEKLEACATVNLPTPTGTASDRWKEYLQNVVRERPFLWRNHRDAATQGMLNVGTSAVVSFPTGAGKSTLSELKVAATLSASGAVVYLAPTHALVSQVKSGLQKTFPKVVVGDSLVAEDFYAEVGEESLAEIAVMTPERCLALLSITPKMFERVRLVIFDECHLLHPKATGQTRRSVDAMLAVLHLARVSPSADWLLLSAMMSNSGELAGWLTEMTGRPCLALNLDWKPTRQARGCLVYDQKVLDGLYRLVETEQAGSTKVNPSKEILSKFTIKPFGFFCLEQTWQTRHLRDYTLVPLLETTVTLSVNKAAGKTAWQLNPNKTEVAAQLAAQCAQQGLRVLLFGQTIDITAKLAKLVEERFHPHNKGVKLTAREELLTRWARLEVGIQSASYIPEHQLAGCHHGELLPVERELVERMFSRSNGMRALAATTTLAQGVNLPADVVLIVGDARWDAKNKKHKMIEAHDLLNAAGRAGRAGQVAQGMVLVLPNFLVGFDPKPSIGDWWKKLRAGIFAKPDQCLAIQDPVQTMLDRLQVASHATDPDLLYFLRRLPMPTQESADEPAKFLRSSLAAYHARRANSQAAFETKVQTALAQRDVALASPDSSSWETDLASRTGVKLEFIVQLDQSIRELGEILPRDTESWLLWFCQWLGKSPERREVLKRHRHVDADTASKQLDLFGDPLFELTWAWMEGEPLSAIALRLGAKSDKLSKCSQAREFVIRSIPEMAYAIGLVAMVRREQIDRGIVTGGMPLALATISMCVRAGQRSPEELAVRLELKEPSIARLVVRKIWSLCQPLAAHQNSAETFPRTRNRVSEAMAKIDAKTMAYLLTEEEVKDYEPDEEMSWDTAAREAVEWALENAQWDASTKSITFRDAEEDRIQVTVTTREELEQYLAGVASDAFYANCSRADGDYIASCDEDGIVEAALEAIEHRLKKFFP